MLAVIDQVIFREKIENLRDCLKYKWTKLCGWETEFILNITKKLDKPEIRLTEIQAKKVCDLWDRI